MMRRLALLAVSVLLAPLAACGGGDGGVLTGEPDVTVDTPLLRTLRARAGIDPCQEGSAAPATDGLPQVTLPCLGGGDAVDLSTLRGPMIMPLWAAWCVNCPEEMPLFERFHRQFHDQVPVVAIDFQDTTPEAALRLMIEKSATYPVLADPGGDVRIPFRVRGLPGVVFVRPDGSFSVRLTRIDDFAELVAMVNEELGLDL